MIAESINKPTVTYCDVCSITIPTELLSQHTGGRKHQMRFSSSVFRQDRLANYGSYNVC